MSVDRSLIRRAVVVMTVAFGILTGGMAAEDADRQVRAMVKECRELLAADRLDEAVEKVRAAIEVEGTGFRTQGTIYNVYSDVMRKRGDAVAADKSLLKAYDCLMKARDAAKSESERASVATAAKNVAAHLCETADGKALLAGYRTKRREKAERQRKEAAEERAAKRAEGAAARGAPPYRGTAKSATSASNSWNPWKKGVAPHKFDTKAKRDEELPWTPDDAAKLTGVPAGRGWNYVDQVYQKLAEKFGKRRALAWYEQVLCRPSKFDIPKEQMENAWNYYGFRAFNALDHGRVLQTLEGLKRCGGKPGGYFAYRAEPSIRMFEDIKTFPRDVATIEFPKENIWVRGKKTVHAKDYGWNATDATACLQKALDDKADIVIVDKMESPWLVTGVKVPSNKTVIFEKGVRVHATEAEQRSNSRTVLIGLTGGTDNQALIGREDVVIGKYPDAATRDRYVTQEGGTGIYLEGAKNVLIRDLTVSECGCDGITLGGCHRMNGNVYIENVTLDHNARQAMSMCNGCDVYMKNVKFVNTRGAQPMAGIDFEPSIQEVEATCNVYLIGCTFENNLGGNIVFSESSTYPVTVLFKDCDIGAHDYGAIRIAALCGLYQGNGTDAPSDIVFDGCDIKGVSWCPPVTISGANLFHLTFRNCAVTEVRGNSNGTSPFLFEMNREYYNPVRDDRTWYQKEGSIAFDGTKVTGWKGAEPFAFVDKTGHYSVKNIFGKLTMNGKSCDMTKFSYAAPDFQFREPVADNLPASSLRPPAEARPSKGVEGVTFRGRAPWWVGDLKYEVFAPAAGGYASQTVKHDAAAALVRRSGAAFRTRCSDGLFRLDSPSTVYFEVPAGKGEAVFKVVEVGQAEFFRGTKVVEQLNARSFKDGYAYVRVKQGPSPAVYGLRATRGPLVFKFFEPYSGIVAADPAAIPSCQPKGNEK